MEFIRLEDLKMSFTQGMHQVSKDAGSVRITLKSHVILQSNYIHLCHLKISVSRQMN